jgi:tetratricopeptide (TPR) repeat protein
LLARRLLDQGNATSAQEWFLAAANKSQYDLYSVVRAASLYTADGLTEQADELLGRYTNAGPELPQCAQLLSEERLDEAIAVLEPRASRGDITVWWPWAMLRADAHGYEHIAEWMYRASDGDDGGHGPLIAADMWAERRELAKVRAAYEAASAADCSFALTWWAAIEIEAGNADDALSWLETRIENGDTFAIWPWARLMEEFGRSDDAIERLFAWGDRTYLRPSGPRSRCVSNKAARRKHSPSSTPSSMAETSMRCGQLESSPPHAVLM